ncbi:MAG: sugar phosphate isomerase/epimerase [Clostridia bacterium]|nr:sugar phosphate isomerase/epimerase [Clostridia bacterium]
MSIKLGAQLFTLRDYIKTYEDTEKTFAYLNSIGINVIQISGIGPIEPEKVAYLVDKYNMDVCVTHTSFDRMLAETETVVKEHKMMHCDTLGIGAMPDKYRDSEEGVREFIKLTDELGRKLRDLGAQFAYHNHSFEFRKVGEKRIIDMLIEDTDHDNFNFILDTYWVQHGGGNPVDYIEKIAGRMKVCHFKDYKIGDDFAPTFAEVGTGNLNLDACYRACRDTGVGYIVIEQDICEIDPRESMAISYENLKKIAERNKG